MLKTILVPVDGSGYANRAIDYASDLASRYGAKVILLHAIHDRFGSLLGELDQHAAAEQLEGPDKIYPAAEKILVTAERRAKDAGAADVALECREGDPAEVILEAVNSFEASAIVMGCRGFSELKGLLVGSVSQKILHHTEVPVTIVR
jgi:nucleotide-binding universal stress UspA family protein